MEQSFAQEIKFLINGQCHDPFSILGMHRCGSGIEVRVFIPNATRIILLTKYSSIPILELSNIDFEGFFIGVLPNKTEKFAYQLDIYWGDYHEVRDDPYRFWFWLQELDNWLLKQGKHLRAYEKLGAHPIKIDNTDGTILLFGLQMLNAFLLLVILILGMDDNILCDYGRKPEFGNFLFQKSQLGSCINMN